MSNVATVPRQDLLERERELERIAEALEASRSGSGRFILVEGAAGIGKSRLLGAAAEQGRELGMTILGSRAAELEAVFAYGVVRQLFGPFVADQSGPERDALFEGAAGLARPLVDPLQRGEQEAPGEGDEAFRALHGLYWLTVSLAERSPLLLSIDDVQWADEPSTRFAAFLLPRLEELPVTLIVARRTGEPVAGSEALERLCAEPSAERLIPAPLSEAATGELVRAAFVAAPSDELCRACHEVSGGNPFYLREVITDLASRESEPGPEAAEAVRASAPAGLTRSVALRVSRLGDAALALARAVAVLGDGADLRLAGRLAGLPQEPARAAADALVGAHVLAPGPELAFLHPVLREAVYATLGPRERAAAHARAAELIRDTSGGPPERIAGQLLLAEPRGDSEAVTTLRQASASALAHGAPQEAISYLRRALEEPPSDAERADVLLELGAACFAAGDGAAAIAAFEEGLAARDDPETLAGCAPALAQALWGEGRERDAIGVLERAAQGIEGSDPERALSLTADLIGLEELHPGGIGSARERLRRLAPRVEDGETPARRKVLGQLSYARAEGDATAEEAAQLAERAMAEGPEAGGEVEAMSFFFAVWTLLCADRLDRVERPLERALDGARKHGSATAFAWASAFRSRLAYLRGEVLDAEAEARSALDVLRLYGGHPAVGPMAMAYLVDALVERDELAAAEAALEAAGLAHATARERIDLIPLQFSRGRLRLARHRLQAGIEDLITVGEVKREHAFNDPFETPWASTAAVALARLGERARARQLVQEELERARSWGTARAIGIALRASALVEEGPDRIHLLEKAGEALEGSPAPLEEARVLADLGSELRRRGERSAARPLLRRALETARRLGATALAKRAHEELAATGEHLRPLAPAGRESLTASERRVAELAATGLSNREIAQALFLTVKTIEKHLSASYRKLDISSRAELAQALSAD